MKIFYTDHFHFPLPADHRFPIEKYSLLRQQILRDDIVDCDVHQGNGTAAILANDPTIFTFSIQGKNNFPSRKEKSDLDVALEDEIGDRVYLEALEKGLIGALDIFEAERVIYLAGADPYENDRFGRLGLSKAGLLERDRMVFRYCQKAAIPVAVTMAGGYAKNIQDSVDIHFQTVKQAVEWHQRRNLGLALKANSSL